MPGYTMGLKLVSRPFVYGLFFSLSPAFYRLMVENCNCCNFFLNNNNNESILWCVIIVILFIALWYAFDTDPFLDAIETFHYLRLYM